MSRAIIIDTDPGQDDAIAILAALAARDALDVRGIVSVAGNVPLELTTRNALRLVELAARGEIPVHAGCARPMIRPLVTAEYVHGVTGLDGSDLPEPTLAVRPGHGIDFIIETVMADEPGTITMCMLGPLTNLAMAIVKEPAIAPRLREIVLMGGGFFEGGNTTPHAEFNIYVDPHAAHVVLNAGVPTVVMPLDVTHKALMPRRFLDQLRALNTAAGRSAAGMLDFYERFDVERYGQDGGPLHDPCVIAYLLKPELFRGKKVNVRVETGSELTMGSLSVDWWGMTRLPPNATYMTGVDAPGFFDLLLEQIAKLK